MVECFDCVGCGFEDFNDMFVCVYFELFMVFFINVWVVENGVVFDMGG